MIQRNQIIILEAQFQSAIGDLKIQDYASYLNIVFQGFCVVFFKATFQKEKFLKVTLRHKTKLVFIYLKRRQGGVNFIILIHKCQLDSTVNM